MNLEEEVAEKIANDERWKGLPYDYAYISIALGLSYAQAYGGFINRQSPEQVYFAE